MKLRLKECVLRSRSSFQLDLLVPKAKVVAILDESIAYQKKSSGDNENLIKMLRLSAKYKLTSGDVQVCFLEKCYFKMKTQNFKVKLTNLQGCSWEY